MIICTRLRSKKNFLFDHVWPIIKYAKKWTNILPKQRQQMEAFEGFHEEIPTPKSLEALFSIDLNANDDQVPVDMQNDSSSSRPMGIKKQKKRKRLKDEKSHLLAKKYE